MTHQTSRTLVVNVLLPPAHPGQPAFDGQPAFGRLASLADGGLRR